MTDLKPCPIEGDGMAFDDIILHIGIRMAIRCKQRMLYHPVSIIPERFGLNPRCFWNGYKEGEE